VAYLGTKDGFITNYPGGSTFSVPALTNDSLAGIPLTTALVGQMRSAVEAMIPVYANSNNACAVWTKTNILNAAGVGAGNPRDWTPFPNNLIQPIHITEIQPVLSLLTRQDISCDYCWGYFGSSTYRMPTNIVVTFSGVPEPQGCLPFQNAGGLCPISVSIDSCSTVNLSVTVPALSTNSVGNWINNNAGTWSGTAYSRSSYMACQDCNGSGGTAVSGTIGVEVSCYGGSPPYVYVQQYLIITSPAEGCYPAVYRHSFYGGGYPVSATISNSGPYCCAANVWTYCGAGNATVTNSVFQSSKYCLP
jgi:hypothetical protein